MIDYVSSKESHSNHCMAPISLQVHNNLILQQFRDSPCRKLSFESASTKLNLRFMAKGW
jgi:hypothetical protein